MKKLYKMVTLMSLFIFVLTACDVAPTPTTVAPATPAPTQPASQATSSGLTKVTIALGYIPDVQFAPFYLALERGYYRDEGLDVTLQNGIVQDLVTQLATGRGIDFAVVSGDELVPARVQGLPVKYVMTWYQQYPVAAASIVGKGPTLLSPADLKGKKVGVPGPYGATYIGLQALLKSAGLKLSDVQLQSIGFTQPASLTQGQVDVAMVYAANEPTQLRSQNVQVSTLNVADYAKLAGNGLATNERLFSSNPDLVQRVVRATLKGIQGTIDDPSAAFDASLKYVPDIAGNAGKEALQRSVLTETIKLMQPKAGDPAAGQPLGWSDPAVWTATQDSLAEFGVINKKVDITQMYTNQFIGR